MSDEVLYNTITRKARIMRKLKDYTIGIHTLQARSLAEAKRIVRRMEAFEKKQKEKVNGK